MTFLKSLFVLLILVIFIPSLIAQYLVAAIGLIGECVEDVAAQLKTLSSEPLRRTFRFSWTAVLRLSFCMLVWADVLWWILR